LNIPQITCDKIAEFSDKAFEYLSAVTIGDSRKSHLSELARGLMVREK